MLAVGARGLLGGFIGQKGGAGLFVSWGGIGTWRIRRFGSGGDAAGGDG